MTAGQLIGVVETAGGRFRIEGDRLGITPREAAAHVIEELRTHRLEIIDILSRRQQMTAGVQPDETIYDPLDTLREPFVRWFDRRVWLDADSLARYVAPRWHSSVVALYSDCCRWMLKHDQGVPPTCEEFMRLLQELCLEIVTIRGEEFVANICMLEDRSFDDDPQARGEFNATD
jgi:hypothetical protein